MNPIEIFRRGKQGRFQGKSNTHILLIGILASVPIIAIDSSVALASELDPLQVMRTRGCAACHIIPGIPEARSTMGPTLKGLSDRKRIVARTLSNNEKNLRRWLKNPKAVKSDTMMPNVGLSDAEVNALIVHFNVK